MPHPGDKPMPDLKKTAQTIRLIYNSFLVIGTTNFAVLQLMVTGKWKQTFRVSEVKFMFLLLLLFIPITALSTSGFAACYLGLSVGLTSPATDAATLVVKMTGLLRTEPRPHSAGSFPRSSEHPAADSCIIVSVRNHFAAVSAL